MAVIVKYVVERDGEEKMTFSTKAEADAYDKMLDLAETLEPLLAKSGLIDEGVQEELAMFLAGEKDALMSALKGKKAPAKKPKEAEDSVATDKAA